MAHRDKYTSFAELNAHEREDVDFRVLVRPVPRSSVSVVAPHGGRIEPHTSAIARAIAGADLNLYLFEGIKASGNGVLHLTSHRFDEPRCLDLVAHSPFVVTVHGCNDKTQVVYAGGLDYELKRELVVAMRAAGVNVKDKGHSYPGALPKNICNRGSTGRGVQVEISAPLRRSPRAILLAQAMRNVLLQRRHAA